ncbi:MAG: GldL-related protein [Bacteroidota bacterium]
MDSFMIGLLEKAGNWMKKRIAGFETTILILFILSLILELLLSVNLRIIITALLLITSSVYYFLAFAGASAENKSLEQFLNRLTGFGSSIMTIGILFKLNNWPGNGIALTGGLLVSAPCLLAFLYFRYIGNKPSLISGRTALRLLVMTAFILILYLVPEETLVQIGLINRIPGAEVPE